MKNLKNIFIFPLILISIFLSGFSITNAVDITLSTDNVNFYSTLPSDVSDQNTLIYIKVLEGFASTATGSYTIEFPTGFEYVSYLKDTTAPSCNGETVTTINNSLFSIDINPTNQFCLSTYFLTYKVTNTSIGGVNTILTSYTSNTLVPDSATLTISKINTLDSIETLDNNSNGYIETVKLTFSQNIANPSSFNNIGLTLTDDSDATVFNPTLSGSVAGNIVYLSFTDNILSSGVNPSINHTGLLFDDMGTISNFVATDKAIPQLMNINSTNVINVNSPIISIYENSKLSLTFSEEIFSNTVTNRFKLFKNGIDITNSSYITFNQLNGNTVYYCIGGYDINSDCNTSFDSNKTYNIELLTGITDINNNSYDGVNLTVSINVLDSTPPVSSSITYNSETNNGIIINGNPTNNNYTNNILGVVNLTIGATDNSTVVSEMCISENNTLINDNVCDTSWKTYSTNDSFTLTGIEGINTLYIKFKDAEGNISSVYSDSIIWDKTNPTSTVLPNGGSFINGSQNITFSCSDTTTSCTEIYYTTDGTIPTTSSTSVTSGTSVSISGTDETIKVKFFTKDIANNQEGLTNSVDFIFSNSYLTFTNPVSITNNSSITLTGTCSNASGSNLVEYSLNGGAYTDVILDNCDTTNIWSTDLVLISNQNNTIEVRIKANISILTSISVKHDNINPSSLSLSINNGDTYSNSTSVNLNISASDTNGINQMCITESSIINNNICTGSTWENYLNTKTFILSSTDGTKTIYTKFKDDAGNISSVINDYITLETTTPTVSSSLVSGNYRGTTSVVLDSINTVYYTLDGTTPTNISTLYINPFNFGETISTVSLKTIAYGNSGINGIVSSYDYSFGCFAVSNGEVENNYPDCTITCNSGYNLSGRTCTAPPSSGGGGGSVTKDYENINSIDTKIIELEDGIINEFLKKYGILDISNLTTNQITGDSGIIDLRSNLRAISKLIIPSNTSIIGNTELIYAPYSLDIIKDLKVRTIKVNNVDVKAYNIKRLFFAGNTENSVRFNKDIELKFNMGGEIDGKIYVYHSDKVDGDFKLIETGIETDKDGLASIKTSELGYFVFIRDIYISRYFGTQTIVLKEIDTKKDTDTLILELKSKVENTTVKALIDKYSKELIIPDMDYYAGFDSELQDKYTNIIKGYTDFILNTDKYLTTKESKYQILASDAYKEYIKVKELKNFENKYIIKTERDGLEIYKTTYTPIVHLVDALESSMLKKLKTLLDTKTINIDKYNKAINDYNEFILHLSIYRQYKNKPAAYKALTPGRSFLKVYKMKVIYTSSTVIPEKITEPIVTPNQNKGVILIKDKYNFPFELKFGDYKKEVQNLQEIMKSYGSFTYPQTTMYFGNVTKTSFVNFARDFLNEQNSNGVLTRELIEKLYNLEYK